MERILTVPSPVEPVHRWPTGNEWVAVPEVGPTDGTCYSINVLHMGRNGLVEFRGEPLLRLVAPVASSDLELGWIPRFRGPLVEARVFAPPGRRGAVFSLAARNRGRRSLSLDLGWECLPGSAAVHRFQRHPWLGLERRYHDDWTASDIWELPGVAALAVRGAGVRHVSLGPGEQVRCDCYVAVGRDGEGAGCCAVDLARRGAEALLAEARAELAKLHRRTGLPRRGRLEELAWRNMLFAYRYAAGMTIDSEELALVTSRSPRYYVAAAHWARDSLLWALPAVRVLDPGAAESWVQTALMRYARHPGEHALYLDGTVLYPGFELDQLAALCLVGGDFDPSPWGDRATGLYRTELLPSDDPAQLPFVTYDNALLAVARKDTRLAAAIRRHCVVEGPFGPQFAWAVDGRGGSVLYDEPPGSLELLAPYGFCAADDPVYRATVQWLHSTHNPGYLGGDDLACPHAPSPWVLSWANALLCGRLPPALEGAALDEGLACETVDPAGGRVHTGPAFATAAGFLGFSLWRHLRQEAGSGTLLPTGARP